jgi:dsRNA-specific ribonuclease
MEYRGIEYHVVQTANSAEWSWTVQMEGREPRTGSGRNRTAAIALAQIAIDKLLKAHPPAGSDSATIAGRASAIEKP